MATMYVSGSTNRLSVHFARKIAARFPGQSFLAWSQKVDYFHLHNLVFPLTTLTPADDRLFFDANHATPFAILPTGDGESGV